MPIQWEESMATGIPSVDEQHQKLIAALNELREALFRQRGPEVVAGILDFLNQYMNEHFGHEEECFARYNCPGAERNRLAHQYFHTWFASVQRDYAAEGPSLKLLAVLDVELMNWFNGHIRGLDKQLRGCASPQE